MKALFSEDVVKGIEVRLAQAGLSSVDAKELIVYIASFFNNELIKVEKQIRDLERTQVRRRTFDVILSSTTFGGGFGLILSGIIFYNGFLSWMGVVCMALGLIHLITSS